MKKLYLPEVRQKATQFLQCRKIHDLSKLGFDTNQVLLHAVHPAYYTFSVRKRSGGLRKIEAPEEPLKQLQRQFNGYLQCVYYTIQTKAAQGYIISVKGEKSKKNILQNATRHLGCKYMLNVDFQDFFHQFSTACVMKMMQTEPFQFNKKSAHVLARLFTYKGRLPMGSPASPALTNIATIRFDNKVDQWATKNKIKFTRFVDDLCFSSQSKSFTPDHLIEIEAICQQHQLKLNPKKTKYFGEKETKKVTGLILRDTVDVPDAFYQEFHKDLKRIKRLAEVNLIMSKPKHNEALREFKQEVDGQINFIGMIEGYNSPIFYKYRQKLKDALNPNADVLSVRWTNINYL